MGVEKEKNRRSVDFFGKTGKETSHWLAGFAIFRPHPFTLSLF